MKVGFTDTGKLFRIIQVFGTKKQKMAQEFIRELTERGFVVPPVSFCGCTGRKVWRLLNMHFFDSGSVCWYH